MQPDSSKPEAALFMCKLGLTKLLQPMLNPLIMDGMSLKYISHHHRYSVLQTNLRWWESGDLWMMETDLPM
jgi:hypothetical protein